MRRPARSQPMRRTTVSAGQYIGGVTQGQAGALGATGKAASFDGSTANVASTDQTGGPSSYAAEFWFNTTTTNGGKLVGFGNSQTGNSGNYDKQVYLTNDGRLIFGVYNGGFDTIYSGPNQNNGQWHHVVAEQGPSGMALYVDDNLVGTNAQANNQGYNGYWRVGGDNLGAWPDRPNTDYYSGTIDEVAIYAAPLTANQIHAHYLASGRDGPGSHESDHGDHLAGQRLDRCLRHRGGRRGCLRQRRGHVGCAPGRRQHHRHRHHGAVHLQLVRHAGVTHPGHGGHRRGVQRRYVVDGDGQRVGPRHDEPDDGDHLAGRGRPAVRPDHDHR